MNTDTELINLSTKIQFCKLNSGLCLHNTKKLGDPKENPNDKMFVLNIEY